MGGFGGDGRRCEGGADVRGLLRSGGRWLKNRCLWPLWWSLAAFAATHMDAAMFDTAATGLPVLPPGVGGPPPAHPERLRADLPLTEQERLLARELWPGYEQRARDIS
ncbi:MULTISPECIES: DUF6059 family protein [unclassified Streptomyces]|uniref:DUF6059 family protein n=1 Tax=unclassified Streptomyces TaxID=2593676 RepID=UPI00224D5669|nr:MULTISPECIES: DUF6059 family protein [unclassified Streptomyces]MCX5335418.1 hypothetical protein [Streptomyces sp. NBC_00140]MCX5338164.1 hypothetical protein [Streptomyces sp. NBC_00140]MCX5367446.1 hypothetical protein [Streptomyces sp. NBC_00124]